MSHVACHWPPGPLVLFVGSGGLGVTGSEVLSKCQGSRGIFFSADYIGGLGGQNEWAWLYIERAQRPPPQGDLETLPMAHHLYTSSSRVAVSPRATYKCMLPLLPRAHSPHSHSKECGKIRWQSKHRERDTEGKHHALPHTVPTLLHQALPCPLHCIPSLPLSPHSHNDHVRLHMGEAWDEKQL